MQNLPPARVVSACTVTMTERQRTSVGVWVNSGGVQVQVSGRVVNAGMAVRKYS